LGADKVASTPCPPQAPGYDSYAGLTTGCISAGGSATACPPSVHTYGCEEYIPSSIVSGGSVIVATGARFNDGNATADTTLYLASTKQYKFQDNFLQPGYYYQCVFNPTDNKVYAYVGANGVQTFNAAASAGSQWTWINQDSPPQADYYGSALDVVNQHFWWLGHDSTNNVMSAGYFDTTGHKTVKTISGDSTCGNATGQR